MGCKSGQIWTWWGGGGDFHGRQRGFPNVLCTGSESQGGSARPWSGKFSACEAAFYPTMEPSLLQPTLPLPTFSFTFDSGKGRAKHSLLTFLAHLLTSPAQGCILSPGNF